MAASSREKFFCVQNSGFTFLPVSIGYFMYKYILREMPMLLNKIKQKREEELKQMKVDAVKKAGFAFVIGSAIGTITALFTAPKSGKELRKDVSKTIETGTEKVKEGAEYVVVKTAEAIEDTVDFGKNLKDKLPLGKKKDTLADKAIDSIEKAEDNIEDFVEDASEIAVGFVETVEEEVEDKA